MEISGSWFDSRSPSPTVPIWRCVAAKLCLQHADIPTREGFAPIGPGRLILNLLARLFADVDRPYDWRHRVFDHKLTLGR